MRPGAVSGATRALRCLWQRLHAHVHTVLSRHGPGPSENSQSTDRTKDATQKGKDKRQRGQVSECATRRSSRSQPPLPTYRYKRPGRNRARIRRAAPVRPRRRRPRCPVTTPEKVREIETASRADCPKRSKLTQVLPLRAGWSPTSPPVRAV
eukprot:172938-Prymnesium_polylepis.1